MAAYHEGGEKFSQPSRLTAIAVERSRSDMSLQPGDFARMLAANRAQSALAAESKKDASKPALPSITEMMASARAGKRTATGMPSGAPRAPPKIAGRRSSDADVFSSPKGMPILARPKGARTDPLQLGLAGSPRAIKASPRARVSFAAALIQDPTPSPLSSKSLGDTAAELGKQHSWLVLKPKRPLGPWKCKISEEADKIKYQSDWLMHEAPLSVLQQLLGGAAAVAQVPSIESRRALLLDAFKHGAGKGGCELAKTRKALAKIAREAELRDLPDGGWPVSCAFAADMVRMEHVRATTAAKPRGKQKGFTVGHGFRATLLRMEKHLKMQVCANHPLVWAAAPTPQKGHVDKAGSFPIQVRVHLEHLAKDCTHEPTRRWCQAFVAFGLTVCLRMIEVLRARLEMDKSSPDTVIYGWTVMKDGSEMEVIGPAEGFTGPYLWFPDFASWASKRQHVLPGANFPTGSSGDITKATSLIDEVAKEAHLSKSLKAVLNLHPLSMDEEAVRELDLTNHSPHGTCSDMLMYMGAIHKFTPLDQDVHANWRRKAVEHEARTAARSGKPGPSADRSTRNNMRVAYSLGSNKEGNRERQIDSRLRLAQHVQRSLDRFGKPWTDLPKGRADWGILKWEEEPETDSETEFSGGYSSDGSQEV